MGLWFARSTFSMEVSGGRSVVDPKIELELSRVDKAVVSLPEDLKLAVKAYYLGAGTMKQKARDCRCSVQTMYSRVEQAQSRIAAMLEEMKDRKAHWPVKSIFSRSERVRNFV